VRAQLTQAGVDMLKRVEDTRLAHMRQLVESLTEGEQRMVLTALRTLTAAHERVHASNDHDDPPGHQTQERFHA
jgi:hypothetical protein